MPQTRLEILEVIKEIVADVLAVPEVGMNETTTADEVDGWDSLTHVQIIVAIEAHFGFRFSFTEVAELQNTGSLIDAVQRLAKFAN